MNKTLRTIVMAVAPLASVATLALGLRLGAESGVHAAMISVVPKSEHVPRAYLRVVTYYDETGVKETAPLDGLALTGSVGDKDFFWSGSSNADGIVEIPIDVPLGSTATTIFVRLTRAGEPYPLAEGTFDLASILPDKNRHISSQHALRPTKREGDIAIDIVVPDGRLAPETTTRAFVKMTTPNGPPKAPHLELHPEPGVEASLRQVCPDGSAEHALVATYHVTGIGITATDGNQKGEWFGGLPVAMGAPRVHVPVSVLANAPFEVSVTQSNSRSGVYLAIDDEHGRAFADFRQLQVTQEGAQESIFKVPALPEGLYWAIASGDSKAIDALDGSAVAHPFLVRQALPDTCAVSDALLPMTEPLPRRDVLEGLTVRRQGDRAKKQKGLFLGLFSLAIAALLEMVLMVSASRDARADLAAKMRDVLEEEEARSIDVDAASTSRLPRIAIALLIALLGFALIAAFVVWRA